MIGNEVGWRWKISEVFFVAVVAEFCLCPVIAIKTHPVDKPFASH